MDSRSPAPTDLVNFDASLLVGEPAVDAQHRSLVGELNRLIADVEAGPSSELFSDVLGHLGRELSAHFRFEETLLGRLDMPAYEVDAHVSAHTEILNQYTDLNLALMRRRAPSRIDALRMIRRWVVDHITMHDVRMRGHLPA